MSGIYLKWHWCVKKHYLREFWVVKAPNRSPFATIISSKSIYEAKKVTHLLLSRVQNISALKCGKRRAPGECFGCDATRARSRSSRRRRSFYYARTQTHTPRRFWLWLKRSERWKKYAKNIVLISSCTFTTWLTVRGWVCILFERGRIRNLWTFIIYWRHLLTKSRLI